MWPHSLWSVSAKLSGITQDNIHSSHRELRTILHTTLLITLHTALRTALYTTLHTALHITLHITLHTALHTALSTTLHSVHYTTHKSSHWWDCPDPGLASGNWLNQLERKTEVTEWLLLTLLWSSLSFLGQTLHEYGKVFLGGDEVV